MTIHPSSDNHPDPASAANSDSSPKRQYRQRTKGRSGTADRAGHRESGKPERLFAMDLLPLVAWIAIYKPRMYATDIDFTIDHGDIMARHLGEGERGEPYCVDSLPDGVHWCNVDVAKDDSCLNGFFVGTKEATRELVMIQDRRNRNIAEFSAICQEAMTLIQNGGVA